MNQRVVLIKVSQTKKDKYHMISLICEIQEKDTNELLYKTEIESMDWRAVGIL